MLFLGISMAITWGISHVLRTKPFISIYIFIHTPILGSMQYEFTDIHRTNHQDLFKQSPDAGWPWLENRFLVGDWGNYGECQFTWMCNSRECAIHIIQLDMQPNNPNKCKGCIDWDRGQCIFMDNQTTADSILIQHINCCATIQCTCVSSESRAHGRLLFFWAGLLFQMFEQASLGFNIYSRPVSRTSSHEPSHVTYHGHGVRTYLEINLIT